MEEEPGYSGAIVTIRNRGDASITGWTMWFGFGNVTPTAVYGAKVSGSHGRLTARPVADTAHIPPGKAKTFYLKGTGDAPPGNGRTLTYCSFSIGGTAKACRFG